MKTAEEWNDEIHRDPGMASDLVRLIEDIQADARRAGMLEAAGICLKRHAHHEKHCTNECLCNDGAHCAGAIESAIHQSADARQSNCANPSAPSTRKGRNEN